MIRAGNYGQALVIVLQGTVRVYRDTSQYPIVPVDGEERPAELSETVSYDDREPIVGFSSCLTNKQYDQTRFPLCLPKLKTGIQLSTNALDHLLTPLLGSQV